MIPLRYNKNRNTAFDDYIKTFKSRLDGWLSQEYVGDRRESKKVKKWKVERAKWSKDTQDVFNRLFPGLDTLSDDKDFLASSYVIDTEAMRLFLYLRDTIGIDKLVDKNTKEMRKLIADVEKDYPGVKDHASQTYTTIWRAFVDLGYKTLDLGKFIEATEASVCPYCNRTFIGNIKITQKDKDGNEYIAEMKGELDHFISKDAHPYLALCRYNLVPSCPFCNRTKRNTVNPKVISPYDLNNHSGIRFRMDITGKHFTNLEECSKAITIKVEDEATGVSMEDNIKAFHLREIYSTHTDYAAEIYYKGRLKWNLIYKFWLKKVTSPLKGCNMTDDDVNRYVLGTYTNPEDFNKRPLSKFQHDLALDAKIIKE